MSAGSSLLARFKRDLAKFGQPLTVTRRPAGQGGAATTQTVTFIVKSLSASDTSPITTEGSLSGNQSDSFMFICAGDADLHEAIDKITYDGADYRVANMDHQPVGNVNVSLKCTGVRG